MHDEIKGIRYHEILHDICHFREESPDEVKKQDIKRLAKSQSLYVIVV